ncbi:sensor histidine kinase [Tenacibaculum xiamenense]|uniref:sensor histidine kinase n=1 Tax=Tenacibaculum xiamenense TaxID=1261553 RepID=UPI003895153D
MKSTGNAYQKFIKFEPLLHLFLWSIVLFYPYIKYFGKEGGYPMSFNHELNSLFFKMTISYFLYLWFYPKKSKLKYILIAIVVFVINTLLYQYFDGLFHTEKKYLWKNYVADSLTYISFGIAFFALHSIKNLYKKQAKIDALSQQKREAEMQALKAQVNPHFLFNTLNTIYASSLKKEDKTPELILKLSDSFRYLLHHGQKEKVTIRQEINHLQDYINLQQARLAKKVDVNFTTNIDNKQQELAPLLVIAFVENAFKYTSILKGENHPIKICLNLENKVLKFTCENPFSEKNQALDLEWEESGVGIKNTQKRLELLYPDAHELTIKKENKSFNVLLKIEL